MNPRQFLPRLPRARHAAIAVALGLAASVAFGQASPAASGTSAQTIPPAPAAPRALNLASPTEQQLPNGLRVVVAERHSLPLVSAQLLLLSGSETDPPGRSGLATLAAGLLTKGTQKRSAPEVAQAAEALGGTLESVGGWHRAGVTITVTRPKLTAALALMAEQVRTPAFKTPELERLREQTLDDLKQTYARPESLATLTATRMAFGAGAYGQPVSGTPASLSAIGTVDVKDWHARYARPDNAVLVLAGDITPQAARELAMSVLGSWVTPTTPLPSATPAAASATAHTVTLVDMGKTGQSCVVLVLQLPAAGAADQAAGEVSHAVLGADFSSRLSQEIRIKRGLSYHPGTRFDARRSGGLFTAYAQTKSESVPEVLALIKHEVNRLANEPVPTSELEARKAGLLGQWSRGLETTAGLATALARQAANGVPVQTLTQPFSAWSAVTPAEVQRYAQAHFSEADRRIAVAGDVAVFEAALKTNYPSLKVVQQSAATAAP